MRRLYLMRHAQTPQAAPGVDDRARSLSSQGRAEAMKTSRFMAENGHHPSLILVSDAVRTQETARIVQGTLEEMCGGTVSLFAESGLYMTTPEEAIARVQMIENRVQSLLLVGHNPYISALALSLDTGMHPALVTYAPATFCAFDLDCASWAEIPGKGARLAAVFVPNQ